MSLSARAIAVQGIGFGPRLMAAQGASTYLPPLTQYEPQAQGAGARYAPERTSRYSDDRAYDPDRVAERIQAIVINGKSYDPFHPDLVKILEQAARAPVVEPMPEIQRQQAKLERTFNVVTEERVIKVPMFRPMLREMPSFTGDVIDFETFSARAKEAAAEEYRRIVLLLLAE